MEKTQADEDIAFGNELLKDIAFFHSMYAKHRDPVYLEIIKNVGTTLKNLKNRATINL